MRNPTAFTSQKTTLYQAVGRPLEPDVTHGFSGRGALEDGLLTKTHILNLLHRLVDGKTTAAAVCRATAKLAGQRHVGWPVWSAAGRA